MKVLKILTNKQKISCVLVIMLAAVSAFLTSTWPVLLSEIYDKISTGKIWNLSTGVSAFLMFGTTFAIAEVFAIMRRVWTDQICVSIEKHFRKLSVEKLLHLPSAFFEENVSGEFTAKVNQSVSGSSQLVKVICNSIVPSVLIGIFTIVQIMCKAPNSIIAIMLSYIVVEILISLKQIKSQNGIREKLIGQKAKLDGCICQSMQNIELIRVTNAEQYEVKRLMPQMIAIKESERKHHFYMGTFDAVKQVIKVVYLVALLFISIIMVSKGLLTTGMVITIVLLFQQLMVPVDSFHIFLDEIASAAVKAKEFVKLIENKDDAIFSREESFVPDAITNSDISINDVNVYTPNMKNVISTNLSLNFNGGKIIGLQGPTGCGKSSLLKAILGYFPFSGNIYLGGQVLDSIPQERVSDEIFYLTQQAIFFEGTLRENLIYGLPYEPSDEQLVFALKNALLYTELQGKCLNVLEYPVAEHALNFSGGQKQRIAIARAFLRQPKWFFADESTANLDEKTEDKVLTNLENYASTLGAGIVYISHSEKVMARCHEIKKMKQVAKAA